MRRCSSREDALDVVADTFATAWRRRDDLPPDGEEARAWLFGIARRCLANTARGGVRADRLGSRLAGLFEPGSVPDPAVVHEESIGGVVTAALRTLTDDDRELVTLIAWEGCTPAQAAAVLGIPAGTVRVRWHRARTRLKAAIPPSEKHEGDRDDH